MGLIEDYRDAVAAEERAFDNAMAFKVGQRGRPAANYQLQRARSATQRAARALADDAVRSLEVTELEATPLKPTDKRLLRAHIGHVLNDDATCWTCAAALAKREGKEGTDGT